MYHADQEKAYTLLFDTYFEVLFLFANRIVRDPEAAKDIVQECFVRFWQHKRIIKAGTGMDKYLFQAVRFESFNHLRNIHRRTGHLEQIARETGGSEKEPCDTDADHFELLYRTINRLPEERRKIFQMICVEGLPYKEVASRLNISINTVKTQMNRALRFLREHLTSDAFFTLLLFCKKVRVPVTPFASSGGL